MKLEQEGIYKVIPQTWNVTDSQSSQSVGINIGFAAIARLQGGEWVDLGADSPVVYGTWWVINREGKPRIETMEELAEHLGWESFAQVRRVGPPSVTVQVTVKAETHEGVTRYKAAWLKPEDHDPTSGYGLDDEACDKLDKQHAKTLAKVTGKAPSAAEGDLPF